MASHLLGAKSNQKMYSSSSFPSLNCTSKKVKWTPERQKCNLTVKIVSILFTELFKNGVLALQTLRTSTATLSTPFCACSRSSIFLWQPLRSLWSWDTRRRFTELLPSKRCTSAFSLRITSSLESSSSGTSCWTVLMEKLPCLKLNQVTDQAWLFLKSYGLQWWPCVVTDTILCQ